jgi:hypothetical protein
VGDSGASTNIASYGYVGSHRLHHRDYSNGIRLTPDYDSLRRIKGTDHSNGSSHVDVRSYEWDRTSSKTSRTESLSTGDRVHSYQYDSGARLLQSTRTVGGTLTQTITYALDGVGNRTLVTGGENPGSYTMAAGNDYKVNQYTSTPASTRTYDSNGNLIQVQGAKACEHCFTQGYAVLLLWLASYRGA